MSKLKAQTHHMVILSFIGVQTYVVIIYTHVKSMHVKYMLFDRCHLQIKLYPF